MIKMDLFDNLNPIDFRYYGRSKKALDTLGPYLSENAFIKYQAEVEVALVKVLADKKLCPRSAYEEVKTAASKVTCKEIYEEEDRIHHNIRALVNIIQKN
ncbi:MAG: adenylosuccinate lyase, partial [Nanoarchaeota archaeon]|nr:adenylosuccinate lyase [Nanoarchaeota archaeon]